MRWRLIVLLLESCRAAHPDDSPIGAGIQFVPGGQRIGAKFAIPLVRDEAWGVFATGRASRTWQDLDIAGVEVLDGSATIAVLRGSSEHRWFATWGIGAGAETGRMRAEAFQTTLAVGGARSVGDSARLGAGIGLSLRKHEIGLHPFFDLFWKLASDLEVSGRLPARLSLSWRLAPRWEAGGLWRLDGGEYLRVDSTSRLRFQRLAIEGFASRDLGTRLRLEVALGWLVRNRVLRKEDGGADWNVWGHELSDSRSPAILLDRPGPVVRFDLALPLHRD